MATDARRAARATPRAVAAVLIGTLHAGLLALVFATGGPQLPALPDVQPIQALLLPGPVDEAPPAAVVAPMAAPSVDLVLPIVVLPESPAAVVESASAATGPEPGPPTPTPAPTPPTGMPGDHPVDVATVEYLIPPAPRYPRLSRRAREQGTVLVAVLIDTDGQPAQVRVHRSSGYAGLDAAACEAVQAARFRPYRENGVARIARALVPVEFALQLRTAGGGPAH